MRRLLAAVLAAVVLLPAVGCAARPAEPESGKLRVVCSLFPYYDFVRAIGGEDVEAELLVPAGRETHSFEPTPLDVIRLSQADVFVYNGGESEYWVEEILDSAGEEIPYTLRLMDYAQPLEEELAEGMQGAGHDDHHDHDDGHEDEVEYDEHIWTSPVTAMALCRAIGETLCQADPDHADSYRQRLADYLAELESLDQSFRDAVAGGSRRLLRRRCRGR